MALVRVTAKWRTKVADDSHLRFGLATLWPIGIATVLTAPQGSYKGSEQPSAPAIVLSLLFAAAVIGILLGLYRCSDLSVHRVWRRVGFTRPRGCAGWRWCWIVAAIVLGVAIHIYLVPRFAEWLPPDLKNLTAAQCEAQEARSVRQGAPLWMEWAHAAGEELLFRCPVAAAAVWALGDGAVNLRQVPRRRVAVLVAVAVLSPLTFGLLHAEFGWNNVVATWVMGSVCTVLAVTTRSVLPAVALHAGYNTVPWDAMTRLW